MRIINDELLVYTKFNTKGTVLSATVKVWHIDKELKDWSIKQLEELNFN